ncbi:MAG TPA: CrcB family protein [Verrucomicrobiae bacterium]|jgi:CrcB protein|nr:CrcB family protein [Verrucomicrobiae bacterium]
MNKGLILAAGGILGTWARYSLSTWVQGTWPSPFPSGTFAVNLAGCFLAGLFFALAEKGTLPVAGTLLLITGFCGAFTTFSAWMLDTNVLLRGGNTGLVFLNLALSLAGGFALLQLGLRLGARG